ncbi:MAG: hypothetical protein COB37_04280 [Kordiimonadales bacterium]|nr:MAG: hypothetical protein COB37_04280 [Kordiimonadales bacterium]
MDDEPTGGVTTARSVEVGSSYVGFFEVDDDIDYIAVELVAGVTYQFDLEGSATSSGTLQDPLLLGIFNGSNSLVSAASGSIDDGGVGLNSRIIFTPTVSGTYFVSARSFANNPGEGTDVGRYTLFVDTVEDSTRPDSNTSVIDSTGNPLIDGLTATFGYNDTSFGSASDGITQLSFSFAQASSVFPSSFNFDRADDDEPTDLIDLTDTAVAASSGAAAILRAGVEAISSFANVVFTEVDDDANGFGVIRLSRSTAIEGVAAGVARLPGDSTNSSDIFISEASSSASFRNFVVLHELGHALGLRHADESDIFPAEFVGLEFSVLASTNIRSTFFAGTTAVDFHPTTFGYLDILAFRAIFGENDTANTEDNTYVFDLNERYFETIFDLGGTDTIQIIGSGQSLTIDLSADAEALNGRFIDVGTTVNYFGSGSFIGSRTETVFISPETVIENILLSDGDDTAIANDAENLLDGGDGNDTLRALAGNDRLFGRDGNDVLRGGTGADFISGGLGNDTASGGAGDDQIFAGPGDLGDDILVGGAGNDLIGGGAGNDLIIGGGLRATINGLEDISSTLSDGGSDILFGGSGDDVLITGSFDDTNGNGSFDAGEADQSSADANIAYAGSGNDQVFGAAGADELGGGTGDDTIDAGAGNDTIYGGRNDDADAGTNDSISGGDGDDLIFASGGADSIDGGAGNDVIFGGSQDDTINGGAGNDEIFNSAGDDLVSGGSGDDTLRGNAGNDILTGDSGNDLFFFRAGDGNDHVTDFSVTDDTLELSLTTTDFTDAASVQAAASNAIIDSQSGVLIDTGGGDTVFLVGLTVNDLAAATLIL